MSTRNKPRNGIWGDEDVWNAYLELKKSVDELIPEHCVGLAIKGTGAIARVKAKQIVVKAKLLEDFVKATTKGW